MDIGPGQGQRSLLLNVNPVFLAKTQNPLKRAQLARVPSIDHLFGATDPDRLICPVRSVELFLARTSGINGRGYSPQGPILQQPNRKSTAASVSCWLKKAITLAYESSEESVFARPHEIRRVAASLLYFNHCSSEDILQAGTWKRHSTFTSLHLRDVAHVGGLRRLPTLVAGQTGHSGRGGLLLVGMSPRRRPGSLED